MYVSRPGYGTLSHAAPDRYLAALDAADPVQQLSWLAGKLLQWIVEGLLCEQQVKRAEAFQAPPLHLG